MPYKDPKVKKAKHKEYSANHYEKNYVKRREEINIRRRRLKAKWDDFKKTLQCVKCGFSHHAALDFHHEEPATKEGNVNRYVSNAQYKKAYEEIKKCIVLCANCHRIHHYEKKKNPAL